MDLSRSDAPEASGIFFSIIEMVDGLRCANSLNNNTGFASKEYDGLLDVCVLPCASHTQFVRLAWRLVRGGHRAAPGVIYTRGRAVSITSAAPLPVQIDGDAAGHTPVTLGLLPRRVGFIVP